MKKFLAVLLVLLLLLTGCSSKITEGEVVKKDFTPEHTQVVMVPFCVSNGKTVTTTLIPYVYHYSDKWAVTIQKYDAETDAMLTATYRVTEKVYDAVEIGAEFVWDEDMTPGTPEYTRERE